jgi:RHS repeat-associated protein
LTNYTYETALQRPEATVDSRTGTTTTVYVSTTCDAAISVTDAGSRVTGFTYDSRGNRLTTTLPDSTVARTSYYPDGQVKATWGSQSYPTFLTYDYAGRRKELHTWRTAPSTLTQSVNEPPDDSSVTTWNYSPTTGTLTSKRDAANKGADYEYTAAGRLWKRTWARGGTTIYTYTAGRLTNTNYPAGTPDVGITYNRLGQTRVITQDNQSKIEYTYDADFALDTEIVSYDVNQDGDFVDELIDHVRTLDRSRDNLGRSNGWQLDTDHQVDYTFDTAGRLATVADGSNTFTYGYLYTQTTAADPRVGSTTGTMQDFMPYTLTKGGTPVLQTVRTYEARRDALASIQNKTGGAIRSSYAYTVNNIGQRTDLTTTFTLGAGFAANSGNTIWAYDPLGQLQSANAPETELSADADRYFQYDDIGNRKLSRTDTASNSNGTLTEYFGLVTAGTPSQPGGNALNQYAAITRSTATLQPVHDFDGNATSYPLPAHNSLSTLEWDAENRLTSVTVNGVTTSYLYDALSRRISKTVDGVTTLYRYDGWNLIAEFILVEVTDPVENDTYWEWTLDFSYTWGLDLSRSLQGAGGVGGLLAVEKHGISAGEYYPTFDGNGNVSEYLEADGDTAAHFEYDPFGNTVVLGEQSTGLAAMFRFRFSTKMLDQETGLYYYGYRFYDPVTGRWPSRDPIEEHGGINLYGFLNNDALADWDFLGLSVSSFRNEGSGVNPADQAFGMVASITAFINKNYSNSKTVHVDIYAGTKKAHTGDDIKGVSKRLNDDKSYGKVFIIIAAHGQIVGENYSVGDIVKSEERSSKGHYITVDSDVLTIPLYSYIKKLNPDKMFAHIAACFYSPHYKHKRTGRPIAYPVGRSTQDPLWGELDKSEKLYMTGGYGDVSDIERILKNLADEPKTGKCKYAVAVFLGRYAGTGPAKKGFH